MSKMDFHFELDNKVSEPVDEFTAKAETRLRDLGENHRDMIGASVALRELSHEQTPHAFEARVIAYIKPENVVATEKADTVELALEGAVDAVETQVRERREKFYKPWEQSDSITRMEEVYDLTARELYATYMEQTHPSVVVNLDRESLAAQLMVDKKLDQDTAYYVADQILVAAQDMIETGGGQGS